MLVLLKQVQHGVCIDFQVRGELDSWGGGRVGGGGGGGAVNREFRISGGAAFQVGFLADRALWAISRYVAGAATDTEAEALEQLLSFLKEMEEGRKCALHGARHAQTVSRWATAVAAAQ